MITINTSYSFRQTIFYPIKGIKNKQKLQWEFLPIFESGYSDNQVLMINTNDKTCMHVYGHDAFIYDNQYGDIMTVYAQFRDFINDN